MIFNLLPLGVDLIAKAPTPWPRHRLHFPAGIVDSTTPDREMAENDAIREQKHEIKYTMQVLLDYHTDKNEFLIVFRLAIC